MSWKTLVPHANTRSIRDQCRIAISDSGRVTIRASAQIFAEAGIGMGDRVVGALGEGEDAGWLRLSKSDRGWKIGSNASGPDERATYKLSFTPRRGLFSEARKSYEVHWSVGGGFLLICWDEKAAAFVTAEQKAAIVQQSIAPPKDAFRAIDPLTLRSVGGDPFGPYPGPIKPRKEVVPVEQVSTQVVAQPPSPEPAAGAVSTTYIEGCPKCNAAHLEVFWGGERGEVGPFKRCLNCGWDEEAETLAGLTMVVAGVAVDQERAEQEALPPEVVEQLSPKARAELQAPKPPRHPPPPWAEANKALENTSPRPPKDQPVAKHGDQFLPLTTPETWRELRQIMHAVKAAGATMTRVNVPMPGRDRMKLNGEEMTPEECLERVRVIVKEWENAA